MSSITRQALMIAVGILIFIGLPVLAWGPGELDRFFNQPARLGYVLVTLLIQFINVLIIKRAGNRLGREQHSNRQRRLVLALIQLFSLALVILAPYSDSRQIAVLTGSDASRYTGLGLYTLGFGLMTWAEASLGKQFSVEVTIQDQHQLITRGLFRYIRHPRYLGIILFGVGIALIFDSLPALLTALALGFTLLWRIRDEEGLLHQQFGKQWETYRQHSWRLIPYLY